MTKITVIDTPFHLPQLPRFITCPGKNLTLAETLDRVETLYDPSLIDLERVYFSKSDETYWFALKPKIIS